jgi:hypothetical protein
MKRFQLFPHPPLLGGEQFQICCALDLGQPARNELLVTVNEQMTFR